MAANAAPIRLATVLDNGPSTTQMYGSGDVTGTLTQLTAANFNALSVADLITDFDVLLVGCCSNSAVNVDWASRLLPFLNAGGGVVFENPFNVNLSQLAPVISASGPAGAAGPWAITAVVPGLTDGINGDIVNEHININSFSSDFSVFLTSGGGANVSGLYGEFSGGGRMVFTSPDNCLHGNRNGTGYRKNQYNLCVNSVKWTASGTSAVSEPGTFALFGLGLVGLGLARRRRRV